jgi:hypothetical protein
MFLDLDSKLRTDGQFVDFINKRIQIVHAVENKEDTRSRELLQRSILEIVRACDYNFSLLVPYFFPRLIQGRSISTQNRAYSMWLLHIQFIHPIVVRGSRQIGKSSALGMRQRILAHMLPGHRSLYVVPHTEQKKSYANRLQDICRAFRFQGRHPNYRQNLNYKEYPNGSVLELIRVLSNASDARSKTAGEIIFDEYQLFDTNLEAEVRQVQRSSKTPITLYTGTSTTIDSPLEIRYLEGSQTTFRVQHGCGADLDFSDGDTCLSSIQDQGLTCPKCSRLVDVESGIYVHQFQDLADKGLLSIHVPQIAIPEFVNDPIEWAKILQMCRSYGTKQILEEVFGIPTSEGSREIDKEDLKRMCLLPETPQALLGLAQKGNTYKYIISGCDWGGSDHNPQLRLRKSFTVHVILGMRYDGFFDILHMRRYGGMGYRQIITQIIEDHVRYKGNAIATDEGVGQFYNLAIRESPKINPDKHLILDYVSLRHGFLAAPASGGWYNQYSLSRDESISVLYDAIARDQPKIRCYAWEMASEFLLDFMNLMRVPQELESGRSRIRYIRAGSKPDDVLHAINFAYTLGRVMAGEPLMEDRGTYEQLQQRFRSPATPKTFQMPGLTIG